MLKSPAIITKSYRLFDSTSFYVKNSSSFFNCFSLVIVDDKKLSSESISVHFKWIDITKTDNCLAYFL